MATQQITYPGPANPDTLVREIAAAINEGFSLSISEEDGVSLIELTTRDPLTRRGEDAFAQVIAAHDPDAKTPEQMNADVREGARVTLTTTDFRDLLARFDAAKDLAEVKAVLRETFVLMLKAAVAADVAVPDILTDLSTREG